MDWINSVRERRGRGNDVPRYLAYVTECFCSESNSIFGLGYLGSQLHKDRDPFLFCDY